MIESARYSPENAKSALEFFGMLRVLGVLRILKSAYNTLKCFWNIGMPKSGLECIRMP